MYVPLSMGGFAINLSLSLSWFLVTRLGSILFSSISLINSMEDCSVEVNKLSSEWMKVALAIIIKVPAMLR